MKSIYFVWVVAVVSGCALKTAPTPYDFVEVPATPYDPEPGYAGAAAPEPVVGQGFAGAPSWQPEPAGMAGAGATPAVDPGMAGSGAAGAPAAGSSGGAGTGAAGEEPEHGGGTAGTSATQPCQVFGTCPEAGTGAAGTGAAGTGASGSGAAGTGAAAGSGAGAAGSGYPCTCTEPGEVPCDGAEVQQPRGQRCYRWACFPTGAPFEFTIQQVMIAGCI